MMLGVLKSGAACVPLDAGASPQGVAHALKDCGAGALVTTAELARRHVSFAGIVVRMDTERRTIESRSPDRLTREEVEVDPRDLCYVIYTPRPGGRPRGVMIEHRGAVHLVESETRLYGVASHDRVFQGASLSSGRSIEEIWLAWRAGGMLVPAPSEACGAGPDLARLLARSGVTVLSTLPAELAMLAEDIPTLRIVILAGDACHDGLVRRWSRPGRRLFRTYGATETTLIATWAELTPGRPLTIGHPFPGNRVILLDERLRPVPAGGVGEICVAGPGVARGYIGRHEDTRRRFVPDFTARRSEGEARMYRTGDLARLAPEGGYELVRRATVAGEGERPVPA